MLVRVFIRVASVIIVGALGDGGGGHDVSACGVGGGFDSSGRGHEKNRQNQYLHYFNYQHHRYYHQAYNY